MKNLIEMEKDICQSFEKASTLQTDAGKIFNPFFERIVDVAFERIKKHVSVPQYITESMMEILDQNILIEKLFHISKRVLIADMNMQRESGNLSGDSEEAQYVDYVLNRLIRPVYLKQLFEEYPVWKQSLFQAVEFFVRNIIEIIQHLYSDQEDLNAEFFYNKKFDKIRRIEGSGSDTHYENRIVYRVLLDNDEVIYHKSRVNRGIDFFNELYENMCISSGFSYHLIPCLIRDGYVWEKEVVYSECMNEKQVENYFIRLGFILSICHLCHSSDMHYENMLSFGEFPLIIDYETLVQMMPFLDDQETKPGNTLIGKSVLSIGILPFYGTPGKAFNADFSGLCGGGKQIMDLKIPIIDHPGKSTMCIAYRFGETRERNNRMRLNGELVNVEKYIYELQQGFENGYRYIIDHKSDIEKMMQVMEDSVFRQLFRNTQEYHMILDLSYHPEFMKEDGKRQEFLLDTLKTAFFEDKPFIIQQEIEDLINGDIPYFQFNMSTGEIQNSYGKSLKKYFERTGMEFLRGRLEAYSLDDMKLQKQLIEISLKYVQVERLEKLKKTSKTNDINNSMILKMCIKIAEWIEDHHIQVENHILWMNTKIMLTGIDKRHTYFLNVCDQYLYEGTMGVAIFMAAFLKVYPEHRIQFLFSKVMKQIFEYTDSKIKTKEKSTGVFVGESSIVYGYQLLYLITKEKIYFEYAKKHCYKVGEYLEYDNQYDLLGGNAGAILAFLNMYDIEKDMWYLDLAKKAADHLIKRAVSNEYGVGWHNLSNDELFSGFAHGCAGIMYSLSRLYSYTNEKKYLDIAYQAFTYEKTTYHPELGGWRDYRALEPYYISDFKWCHGVAGIILGWSLSSPYFDQERRKIIDREISYVLKNFPNVQIKEEFCLCHGNMGNIMIGKLSGVDTWKNDVEENMKQSVQVLYKLLSGTEGEVVLYEQYDYSLMTGWSGIGYALLQNLPLELPEILGVQLS